MHSHMRSFGPAGFLPSVGPNPRTTWSLGTKRARSEPEASLSRTTRGIRRSVYRPDPSLWIVGLRLRGSRVISAGHPVWTGPPVSCGRRWPESN